MAEYNFADELLSGSFEQAISQEQQKKTKTGNIDFASELLSGITPRQEPTGVVSTITGEPITREAPGAPSEPGFGTRVKAGIVDKPEAKIRIYAAARFPDLSEEDRLKRYAIYDGEIVFLADDGSVYRETEAPVRQFIGETIAQTPAIAGGTAGAVLGGVPGAALGAGAGEAMRKMTGALVFGEDQISQEVAKDIGLEAALAGGGEAVGKLGGRILKRRGIKKGGALAKAAGRDVADIEIEKVKRIERLFEKYGIDPFSPQTTGSRELLNKFSLLQDLSRTAKKMQGAVDKQTEQVQDAVNNYLAELYPEISSLRAGKKLTKAADESIQSLRKIRKELTSPLYLEAFEAGQKVDIKPVIIYIDEQLKTAKGELRRQLKRAKTILMQPDLIGKKKRVSKILDAKGQPIIKEVDMYDTSLEGLHASKMEFDRIIDNARIDGLGNTIKRKYKNIREMLLGQMDTASPEYKVAREQFRLISPPVTEAEKSIVGQLTKLEGDKVVNSAKRLFSSVDSSPETVKRARKLIMKQSPEAWDAALKTYLNGVFENIKSNVKGDYINLAGQFWKNVYGNTKQRNIMKAAMGPEKFNAFSDFMEVLKRVSLIGGKESATATRQQSLKEIKRASESRIIAAATRPLYTYQRIIGDDLNEMLFGKYLDDLSDALLSKKAAERLKEMKKIKPGTEKTLEAMATFTSLVIGGEFATKEQ